MKSKTKLNRTWLFVSLIFCSLTSSLAQEDIGAGKVLFRDNCAACHHKDMETRLVGPALAGTEERWKDYPAEDLIGFIRNALKLIESGHKKANEIYEEFRKIPKPPTEHLSDDDINNILAYIRDAEFKIALAASEVTDTMAVNPILEEEETVAKTIDKTWLYIGVEVALFLIAFIWLIRIRRRKN